MLAYVLAIAVGLGSFALYLAAFFFPEIHRKNDFIWSGVGLFYALVLWICAGRITGGVLLGQMASVSLLGWLGWQTVILRLAIARSGVTEISLEISEKLNKFNPFKPKKAQKPPVVQDKTPEITTPQEVTTTPDLIEETPVIEENIPLSFQETPVIEENIPLSSQETPVIEENIPLSSQETPVIEETPPESVLETGSSVVETPKTPEVDQFQETIISEIEASPTPEIKPVTPKTAIKEQKKSGFSIGGLLSGLFSKKPPKNAAKTPKIEKIEQKEVLEDDDWGDEEVTKTEIVESSPVTDEIKEIENQESSPVTEEITETETLESSPVTEEAIAAETLESSSITEEITETETVESSPITEEILEETPLIEETEATESETPIEETAVIETPIEAEISPNAETIEPETVIPEVESTPVETKLEETTLEEDNSSKVILEAKIVAAEGENQEKTQDFTQ